MSLCSEVAIFKVTKHNIPEVMRVSLLIFQEINRHDQLISSYDILQSTAREDEVCWQLTWTSEEAVKQAAELWHDLPSREALEALVGEKLYYGHFTSML
ncbi:hypothetical protein [Psychromonas sp. KJ10-2]|uniref:hypothetical protein n=1 Tax=Psychromonas sp. KJ10-2 TaxID=3391822 RepID=UPI0039B6B222